MTRAPAATFPHRRGDSFQRLTPAAHQCNPGRTRGQLQRHRRADTAAGTGKQTFPSGKARQTSTGFVDAGAVVDAKQLHHDALDQRRGEKITSWAIEG